MFNSNVNSRNQQFDAKHGSDAILVDGWLIYSDGAMRERLAHGVMIEPPEDPHKLAKLQLSYREELLRRAVDEFQTLRNQLHAMAQANANLGMPAPPDSEIQQLKDLQKLAKRRQRDYAQARKQVEATIPENVRRREAGQAANRQRNELYLAELGAIKL